MRETSLRVRNSVNQMEITLDILVVEDCYYQRDCVTNTVFIHEYSNSSLSENIKKLAKRDPSVYLVKQPP